MGQYPCHVEPTPRGFHPSLPPGQYKPPPAILSLYRLPHAASRCPPQPTPFHSAGSGGGGPDGGAFNGITEGFPVFTNTKSNTLLRVMEADPARNEQADRGGIIGIGSGNHAWMASVPP